MKTAPHVRPSSWMEEALAHADTLYRVAHQLAWDQRVAEDLVYETYARAQRGLEKHREHPGVACLLLGALRTAWAEMQGTAGRMPRRNDALSVALASLSGDEQLAVCLDLEGWAMSELACVFGCSSEVAHARLLEARQKLRGALQM